MVADPLFGLIEFGFPSIRQQRDGHFAEIAAKFGYFPPSRGEFVREPVRICAERCNNEPAGVCAGREFEFGRFRRELPGQRGRQSETNR